MSYFFDSTGGCERCDAMGGYYDEEPSRPHPNCNCEISSTNTGEEEEDENGVAADVEWEIVDGPNIEMDYQGFEMSWSVEVNYSMECPDGRTEVDEGVNFGYLGPIIEGIEDYMIAKFIDHLDEMERRLRAKCEDEGEPQV